MIPDPMVRLREMAPDGVRWFAGDNIGYAWFVNSPKYSCAWIAPGKFNTTGWRARTPTTPFALNLRTGAAKFPDGTTIPEAVWMRYYRARAGGV